MKKKFFQKKMKKIKCKGYRIIYPEKLTENCFVPEFCDEKVYTLFFLLSKKFIILKFKLKANMILKVKSIKPLKILEYQISITLVVLVVSVIIRVKSRVFLKIGLNFDSEFKINRNYLFHLPPI